MFGISPDPEKINTIKQLRSPDNIKQLRSFLGMVNYCGRFIRDLQTLTKPLRELLKADSWFWNE